jgi:threonine/homoserine/homoserine lactone efflux protein
VIPLHLYAAFVFATVILMLIPGPNVSVIVANSVSHGTRYGMLALAGTVSATLVQLTLVGFGMAAVMGALAGWFGLIRWAGVAYLIVLGIRQWRAPIPAPGHADARPRSLRAIWLRGVVVAATNPKTLLFYGAFFPQFVRPDRPAGPQLALLCATYILVALGIDSLWALLAGRARGWLTRRARLRNRLSGGALIGAGIGLALVHRR